VHGLLTIWRSWRSGGNTAHLLMNWGTTAI
jgi:hypothetical protein